jgi:Tfp pilus assembly protein FimT
LLIVLVVVSVISAYVYIGNGSAGTYTVRSQAETLAADIRHVQALATSTSKKLQLRILSSNSYQVCDAVAFPTCASGEAIINPVTGTSYVVTLSTVTITSTSTSVDFDRSGAPTASVGDIFVAASDNASARFKISITPVSGYVTVSAS